MITIYKYEINIGVTKLLMPRGAELLSVQLQPPLVAASIALDLKCFFLWARIDERRPLMMHTIRSYGTGHEMPNDLDGPLVHISTVLDGQFVWHFFEDLAPCQLSQPDLAVTPL